MDQAEALRTSAHLFVLTIRCYRDDRLGVHLHMVCGAAPQGPVGNVLLGGRCHADWLGFVGADLAGRGGSHRCRSIVSGVCPVVMSGLSPVRFVHCWSHHSLGCDCCAWISQEPPFRAAPFRVLGILRILDLGGASCAGLGLVVPCFTFRPDVLGA